MPWCLPPIGTSGQVHPRSQGLLLGQGSTACPLATLRWIHPFLTRILHVLGPVSTASHCLCILVFKDKHFVKIEFKYIYYFYFYFYFFVTCVSVFDLGSQVMPTSMPPPRKLPQRPWAASIPTILTHNALHVLLLPSPTPCHVPGLAGSYLCSPLERFLGSVIMRRHLQRIIQQEANVSDEQSQKSVCCLSFPKWYPFCTVHWVMEARSKAMLANMSFLSCNWIIFIL